MMNPIRAGLLALVVGVCISAGQGLTLSRLQCVFMEFANVTCQWEPSEDTPPGTRYILQVNLTRGTTDSVYEQHERETVSETRCSVPIGTLNSHYCIQVKAKSPHAEASSSKLCIDAIDAAKLYAPGFTRLSAIPRKPRCLEFQWSEPEIFPLIEEDVDAGLLFYQLEYSTERQSLPHILEVDLRQKEQCVFSPFTLYTVRIRYRYRSTLSHWSDWSSPLQARTEEAVPSVPPQLWRQIERVRTQEWRHVTLLWKPLPKFQANGRVLGYRVSCWPEPSGSELDLGGCHGLSPTETSCQLRLPTQGCSCSLSASNSAGDSPPAVISIPSALHKESRDPVPFRVTPLDNIMLQVQWDAHAVPLASGFVVEWCAASESSPCRLYWEKLSPNCSSVNITEGVEPMVGYTVSVRAEFGAEAGPEQPILLYTRQGVPSAGPRLNVTKLSSGSVFLQWDAVPLEKRHGFIRNYTLYYESSDHSTTSVVVSGDLRQYQLSGLSGQYSIYITASTDAGQGAAGRKHIVFVRGYAPSVGTILSCSIPTLLTGFVLFSCLRWRQRIKHTFWPWVPDPSQSSLSHWTTGKLPVLKVETKDSKEVHVQSSTNKDLLSCSGTNLCVLEFELSLPIDFRYDPPWPNESQSQITSPLPSQYVTQEFVHNKGWLTPSLSKADSSYCTLLTTETQKQGTGFS